LVGEPYFYGLTNGAISRQPEFNQKDGPVTAADVAVSHYILKDYKHLGNQDFAYVSEETTNNSAVESTLGVDY